MPLVTSELDHELSILAEGCGLVDRSERGKLALTGPEAKAFLQGQVSNDVEALTPGSGCYAAFLTHKGKMLGDLRILDTGSELWLDTERVALQGLFTMIHRYKVGRDVEVHKRTVQQGLLSLVGPRARAVAGASALGEAEHANVAADVAGLPVLLVASDVGVDVVCAGESTPEVRAALVERGAVEVTEAAAEVVRVLRGRPRYGPDLDETTIPQEAGLNERAVSFTKGCYVGQETVARLFYRGRPTRHLRGVRLSAPAETGAPVFLGDREVGRLGSVALSPREGPIALALLRREAEPDGEVRVGDEPARVVALPFAD